MNHKILKTVTTGAVIASLLAPALSFAEVGASVKINAQGPKETKANAAAKGELKARPIDSGNIRIMKATSTKPGRATSTATSTKPKKDDTKFQPRIQANIKGKLGGFFNRFERAIAVEENFVTRVDSRIAKVEAEGRIASTSKKHSADAKVHIKAAKDTFAAIKASVNATTTASTTLSTKENVQKVVAQLETVKTHLKEAHKSIVAAITSLKGIGAKAAATTTISQ